MTGPVAAPRAWRWLTLRRPSAPAALDKVRKLGSVTKPAGRQRRTITLTTAGPGHVHVQHRCPARKVKKR
jgi:hypothetical protein